MRKVKIILLCLMTAVITFGLAACSGGGTTIDQSWAANETLEYNITDSDKGNAVVGNASFVTTTKLSEEDKTASPDADTKMTATVKIGNITRVTVYYAKIYKVLKLISTYTDTDNPENNYVLNAYHDDKNYVYKLEYPSAKNKNKEGKLNVGESGYSDGEFLYFYIRCHDISAVPSSIKVADPFTDTVTTLTCTAEANNASVATSTELGTVTCDKVNVNRADTPVGRGISVYFLPETKDYTYGEGSMIKSVCFPTKIVENNLIFTLSNFSATK